VPCGELIKNTVNNRTAKIRTSGIAMITKLPIVIADNVLQYTIRSAILAIAELLV